MQQSGNPTLKPDAFRVSTLPGEEVMTQNGTYLKTAVLLVLCVFSASYTWGSTNPVYLWGGLIGGLVLAIITVFKKEWSPITAPLYALAEGLVLGGISSMYASQYPGIVENAIMLTFAVMAVMLFTYSTGMIKVTDTFRTVITIATGAIFLVYIVSLIMGFFGTSIPMIHGAGPIGIGFSVIVVGIAAFNLMLDFDFIDRAANTGNSPKYMEWYGAFGLVVTLVWLYLEILRLLSKLNRR